MSDETMSAEERWNKHAEVCEGSGPGSTICGPWDPAELGMPLVRLEHVIVVMKSHARAAADKAIEDESQKVERAIEGAAAQAYDQGHEDGYKEGFRDGQNSQ
jgi:flagellar biosynthesis/type III secretory pathway protein FliH